MLVAGDAAIISFSTAHLNSVCTMLWTRLAATGVSDAIRGVLADAFVLALDRGAIRLAGTRNVRAVRPRNQRRVIPRSLGFDQSAHHGRSAVDPVRRMHRHGRRRQ